MACLTSPRLASRQVIIMVLLVMFAMPVFDVSGAARETIWHRWHHIRALPHPVSDRALHRSRPHPCAVGYYGGAPMLQEGGLAMLHAGFTGSVPTAAFNASVAVRAGVLGWLHAARCCYCI